MIPDWGGSVVAMFCSTRCTIMAASSWFFPTALASSCISLSRWPQKNSGSSYGAGVLLLTRSNKPSVAVSSLQLVHRRAECIIARRIQQEAGDRERSGNGATSLALGWPKRWPVCVVSVLSVGKRGKGLLNYKSKFLVNTHTLWHLYYLLPAYNLNHQ